MLQLKKVQKKSGEVFISTQQLEIEKKSLDLRREKIFCKNCLTVILTSPIKIINRIYYNYGG